MISGGFPFKQKDTSFTDKTEALAYYAIYANSVPQNNKILTRDHIVWAKFYYVYETVPYIFLVCVKPGEDL